MNVVYYTKSNEFIDANLRNMLVKHDCLLETVDNLADLIAKFDLIRINILIIPKNNEVLDELLSAQYIKFTKLKNVDVVYVDTANQDKNYIKNFTEELQHHILDLKNKNYSELQVKNLDYVLFLFHFFPKNKAFFFLKDIIKLNLFLNYDKKMSMTKLYERVAKMRGTTRKNVERLIREMIVRGWKKIDKELICEKLEIPQNFFQSTPTTKMFVEVVCGYLENYN